MKKLVLSFLIIGLLCSMSGCVNETDDDYGNFIDYVGEYGKELENDLIFEEFKKNNITERLDHYGYSFGETFNGAPVKDTWARVGGVRDGHTLVIVRLYEADNEK